MIHYNPCSWITHDPSPNITSSKAFNFKINIIDRIGELNISLEVRHQNYCNLIFKFRAQSSGEHLWTFFFVGWLVLFTKVAALCSNRNWELLCRSKEQYLQTEIKCFQIYCLSLSLPKLMISFKLS